MLYLFISKSMKLTLSQMDNIDNNTLCQQRSRSSIKGDINVLQINKNGSLLPLDTNGNAKCMTFGQWYMSQISNLLRWSTERECNVAPGECM